MKKSRTASMTDIHRHAAGVFRNVDFSHDVLLLSRNNPRYVLVDYNRFIKLIENFEDTYAEKLIDKAREAKTESEEWEVVKQQLGY